MNDVAKVVADALEKSLPEIVDAVTDKKILALTEKSTAEMEEIKTELKKIALAGKQTNEAKSFAGQTAIVNIFKNIAKNGITSEEAFEELAKSEIKAAFMSEGTATEGAEMVFSQFESQIINVMKQYPVVNEVKIYSTRGKDLSIPKVTNGITTAWIAEGVSITGSKAVTAFVSISVYKAACRVQLTEELREDNMTVPEVYAMLTQLIGESQGAFVEDAILNGDGTQVDGVFNNASVKIVTSLAGNVKLSDNSGEELDNLLNDLDTAVSMEYQTNPNGLVAVMSQYTFNVLRKAKNTITGFIMFPELRDANPKLLGKYRVIKSHKAPVQNTAADVAGAAPICIGDLSKYYGFVRRRGLTVVSGLSTGDFEGDLVSVKATQRFGGEPTIPEAFAKVKNAAV